MDVQGVHLKASWRDFHTTKLREWEGVLEIVFVHDGPVQDSVLLREVCYNGATKRVEMDATLYFY